MLVYENEKLKPKNKECFWNVRSWFSKNNQNKNLD